MTDSDPTSDCVPDNAATAERAASVLPPDACVDIVILTNGPGEVVTWVRPVVRALRQIEPGIDRLRISVVLAPCPYASGHEAEAVRRIPGVDRVAPPACLQGLLRTGRTDEGWDWRETGLVAFLGGDRDDAIRLGRRLGYPRLIYAERDVRGVRRADAMALRESTLLRRVPVSCRGKVRVVGDLVADVTLDSAAQRLVRQDVNARLGIDDSTPVIGLLPGSKDAKLTQGVPFVIGVAQEIARRRPEVCLMLPLAPTVSLKRLLGYADGAANPMVQIIGSPQVHLLPAGRVGALPCLETENGTRIWIWDESPAHDAMARCTLCSTTVGAVTAELGVLAVPMLVFFLTQKLDALNTWTGMTGRITSLAFVGRHLRRLVNATFFAWIRLSGQRFAWPNLWARDEVVPEHLGAFTPAAGADLMLSFLDDRERLAATVERLRALRAPPGAAATLARWMLELAADRARNANA